MAKYVYQIRDVDGHWFVIASDTVVARSATDGTTYETAEIQLLWERANELLERELAEMEPSLEDEIFRQLKKE